MYLRPARVMMYVYLLMAQQIVGMHTRENMPQVQALTDFCALPIVPFPCHVPNYLIAASCKMTTPAPVETSAWVF